MTAVLEMLSTEVGYSYKVVNKQQLVEALPKKYQMDVDTFVNILSFLKENEYIVVKYQDKDDICLTLTVKAETLLAGEKEVAVKSKITVGQVWLMFLGVFLAAFCGSMCAVLIGNLF